MAKFVQVVLVLVLVPMVAPSAAALADTPVSHERATRFHLTGAIGVTAAFQENVLLAAPSIDARFYAPEGIGVLLRIGYEGLIYLNFGVIDLALAMRHELPGGQWAGLGLDLGVGVSGMIRDSVYHFTGDDVAFALFTTAGVDVRLGGLLIGVDVIARRQAASHPIAGQPTRDEDAWLELGGAIRIGGEVLL